MNEYTLNNNLHIVSEDQQSASIKRLVGKRDQRIPSMDAFPETHDDRSMSLAQVRRAFRAVEQLMLHRQESKQLSTAIINIFTETLQVDGACLYTYTAEQSFEVLACNATWSNLFSTPHAARDVGDQNILFNPVVLLPGPVGSINGELHPSSKVVSVSLGMQRYGSLLSLPLICEGTTVGAISLFSVSPQFFVPERIDVLRTVACLAASLYGNMNMRKDLEKEQRERITLQQDVRQYLGQLASLQRTTDTNAGAEAAYAELEALSYSLSHDLRGPILTIRNISDWLNTQHAENLDGDGLALLQQITASSDHMEKLLDGLLEFSKVVQLDPHQSLIDMTALARSVIDELLKGDSGSSSLSIAVQPLIPAYGDATLIRQVWYNLLSNAFKYTRFKVKREVTIDSFPFNGGVKYCVRDNGIGFDMQYVGRLFGAFHRLHRDEEFEGTGVGLAIVQRIVHRHGGQVWAEGRVDNGAQFYFTLPKT
jgi:signal transduction histidine kinase